MAYPLPKQPTPAELVAAMRRVTRARDRYLAVMPMPRIIEAIDRAVRYWFDPGYKLRQEAEDRLPAMTGYSADMFRTGLPLLLEPFNHEGLLGFIKSEFRGEPPKRVDREGHLLFSRSPRLIVHALAGNIPSIGAESIIRALLVRSASVVKASTADPLFPALFVESLKDADSQLAASVAVFHWKGGQQDLETLAASTADAVIAYGGEDAISTWRALTAAGKPFIEHGGRIGFAVVGMEEITPGTLASTAAKAAWDVAFFDQQGCVSPHAIFVEREVSEGTAVRSGPLRFAKALAAELESLQRRLPRGHLSSEEHARIQAVRADCELRAAAGQSVQVFKSDASTEWTVLYEEGAGFLPTCLNRTVRVIAVDAVEEVPVAIAPLRAYLQTAGVAINPERLQSLVPLLEAAGVTRVCPLGRMQHPPANWLHDGRHPLRELLRWVDLPKLQDPILP